MSYTGMHQRCRLHDYRAPCFYLITLATEPRRSCLGRLEGEKIRLSPLGEMMRQSWFRSAEIYPGVEPGICAVMPDHFHGLLRVKERLAKPMGQVVRGFKASTTFLWRRDFGGARDAPQRDEAGSVAAHPLRRSVPATFWQKGFQDTILLRRGQLERMRNYILDNPRRLAMRRAHHHDDKRTITREQGLALNRLAQDICADFFS